MKETEISEFEKEFNEYIEVLLVTEKLDGNKLNIFSDKELYSTNLNGYTLIKDFDLRYTMQATIDFDKDMNSVNISLNERHLGFIFEESKELIDFGFSIEDGEDEEDNIRGNRWIEIDVCDLETLKEIINYVRKLK